MNDLSPKVYTIRKCEDLIAAVRHMSETCNGADVWWRGESCSTWPLLPSVFRYNRHHRFERNVLGRFIMGGSVRHVKCPPNDDTASWSFFGQHFGLPTRILDWSESIFIAAFFAVDDRAKDNENATIWALLPFSLNKLSSGIIGIPNEKHPEVIEVLNAAYDKASEKDVVIATATQEIDFRMSLQQARFTVHGNHTALDQIHFENPVLQKFIIPSEDKAELRRELYLLGIRRSTIFPDLQNLALELTRFWEDGVSDDYFEQTN
jgi:hypothetical protein